MKPRLHDSLAIAYRVLRALKLPESFKQLEPTITGYENGREHGLQLLFFTRRTQPNVPSSSVTICWAEARSSDEIVVYVSELDERFGDAGAPTERAFQAARYFKHGRYAEAARYIATEAALLAKAGG